jgi:hypothetical protein
MTYMNRTAAHLSSVQNSTISCRQYWLKLQLQMVEAANVAVEELQIKYAFSAYTLSF